jgi:hypothetical protein
MSFFTLFIAGAFLCNAMPYLTSGLQGTPFPTPFAKPPGVGDSSWSPSSRCAPGSACLVYWQASVWFSFVRGEGYHRYRGRAAGILQNYSRWLSGESSKIVASHRSPRSAE